MTLILTELSQAGIAMVANSAISRWRIGRIVTKDQQQWKKLLRVSHINAGISSWGAVGAITRFRFDDWLAQRIKIGNYNDLRSLADYIAEELNNADAVGGKPLRDELAAGVHVAGHQKWADGISRPTFYHVHNGPGHTLIEQSEDVTVPKYVFSPRELFTRHNDFSSESQNSSELINLLNRGGAYLVTNGDYYPFHVIAEGSGGYFKS